jgi:hydroxymethylbilane synthase
MAERALNQRLNGGCQVPIAGYAELSGECLRLRGVVGTPDGQTLVRGEMEGSPGDPRALGFTLAEDLLTRGADRILNALYA